MTACGVIDNTTTASTIIAFDDNVVKFGTDADDED
jgi:hypothetical protein